MVATPAELRRIHSVIGSYRGHFQHANAARLVAGLHRRFPWLHTAATPRRFDWRLEGRPVTITTRGACHG